MKLVVIGIGQCGGMIADEFARLNKRAHSLRGIDIITDLFAVNTDIADLNGLRTIKADNRHRMLIGSDRTRGHGVARMNKQAAEIARSDGYKVIDAIRTINQLPETDAFLLVAGASGGTGSGATPIMAQQIKELYAVSFTSDCDGCVNCARYCFYGVHKGGELMADSDLHSTAGYRWF